MRSVNAGQKAGISVGGHEVVYRLIRARVALLHYNVTAENFVPVNALEAAQEIGAFPGPGRFYFRGWGE
jgi:hypothetical protein